MGDRKARSGEATSAAAIALFQTLQIACFMRERKTTFDPDLGHANWSRKPPDRSSAPGATRIIQRRNNHLVECRRSKRLNNGTAVGCRIFHLFIVQFAVLGRQSFISYRPAKLDPIDNRNGTVRKSGIALVRGKANCIDARRTSVGRVAWNRAEHRGHSRIAGKRRHRAPNLCCRTRTTSGLPRIINRRSPSILFADFYTGRQHRRVPGTRGSAVWPAAPMRASGQGRPQAVLSFQHTCPTSYPYGRCFSSSAPAPSRYPISSARHRLASDCPDTSDRAPAGARRHHRSGSRVDPGSEKFTLGATGFCAGQAALAALWRSGGPRAAPPKRTAPPRTRPSE